MTDAEIVKACAEARGWKPDHDMWLRTDGVLVQMHNWNPLTIETDCWGLVDSLLPPQEWRIDLLRLPSGRWMANIGPDVSAVDPDRRRAICLAYLRAKGVEV